MTTCTQRDDEVLKTARETFHRALEGGIGYDDALTGAVRVAVAEARAQDAARGGTLTADELENIRRLSEGLAISSVVRDLLSHLAAQGRAIAALEARAEQAEGQQHSDMKKVEHWRERAKATESALATLRQKVEPIRQRIIDSVDFDASEGGHWMLWVGNEDERDGVATTQEVANLLDALAATPSEHPDTAASVPTEPSRCTCFADADCGWCQARAAARAQLLDG